MLGPKRKQAEAADAALPVDVAAALEEATLHIRHDGEDGMPRVIVQPAGMRGWMHGDKDAERLAAAYPELTEAQLIRACRFLASRVKGRLRELEQRAPKRANWVTDW